MWYINTVQITALEDVKELERFNSHLAQGRLDREQSD